MTEARAHGRPAWWLWMLVAVIVVVGGASIGAYVKSHRTARSSGGVGTSGTAMLCLAGSNTIGTKLAPALAEGFLKQLGATDVKVLPGAAQREQIVRGVLPGATSAEVIRIDAQGTASAFDRLADGSCDIGMASRRITQDEITKLPFMGDLTSPSDEHLLALDGIAVVVNGANPVPSLTKEQLAGIFSGAISNWSQVSSQQGSIAIYAPAEKSGTDDTFKSLVLGDAPLAANAKRLQDSAAVSSAVASDRTGIGLVGLAYVGSARAIAVSERGAIALQPNRLTIATEDYPLSRRLYLYTPANPTNNYVRRFVEFAVSNSGQDVVAAAGFVPPNVVAEEKVTTSENAPPEYNRLTRGAGRLSLDFRFLPGGAVLDNKAITDINRVVDFMGDLGYGGNNILLFGFADNSGNPQLNVDLSQARAYAVADEFKQRGLKPGLAQGFGDYLPVASNDTAEGRQKNRRVEIWLKK